MYNTKKRKKKQGKKICLSLSLSLSLFGCCKKLFHPKKTKKTKKKNCHALAFQGGRVWITLSKRHIYPFRSKLDPDLDLDLDLDLFLNEC